MGRERPSTRRGFGASSHPESGYDITTRAGDILAVADHLKLDRLILRALDRRRRVDEMCGGVPGARFFTNEAEVVRLIREFLLNSPKPANIQLGRKTIYSTE